MLFNMNPEFDPLGIDLRKRMIYTAVRKIRPDLVMFRLSCCTSCCVVPVMRPLVCWW
jgi:hypothetical protein